MFEVTWFEKKPWLLLLLSVNSCIEMLIYFPVTVTVYRKPKAKIVFIATGKKSLTQTYKIC